jgi:hypothetical protein
MENEVLPEYGLDILKGDDTGDANPDFLRVWRGAAAESEDETIVLYFDLKFRVEILLQKN